MCSTVVMASLIAWDSPQFAASNSALWQEEQDSSSRNSSTLRAGWVGGAFSRPAKIERPLS